ncbi:high mobility group box 3, partial [Linderina pennispora]
QLSSKKALVKLPKGPARMFAIFINEVTADLKKDQSGVVNIAEITRVASQRWRTLSDAEKQKYQVQQTELKKKYEQELRQWWATVDRKLVDLENKRRRRINAAVAKEGKGSRVTLLKDPFAPKRPPTSYIVYASEKLSQSLPVQGITEMSAQAKMVAAQWRSLSDAEKAPYVLRAKEAKAKFDKDLAAYNAKIGA